MWQIFELLLVIDWSFPLLIADFLYNDFWHNVIFYPINVNLYFSEDEVKKITTSMECQKAKQTYNLLCCSIFYNFVWLTHHLANFISILYMCHTFVIV